MADVWIAEDNLDKFQINYYTFIVANIRVTVDPFKNAFGEQGYRSQDRNNTCSFCWLYYWQPGDVNDMD